MSESINLISSNSVQLEKELKRLKQLRMVAVVGLVIVSLVSILIFILNFTLPLNSVKQNQQLTIANLTSMHQKLATYTLTRDRIANISKIIALRGNYVPQINEVLGKVPAELSVDSLEVQTNTLKVTISGGSLSSINKFIDDMISLGDQGKVVKNIVIQGLSFDTASGKYSLSMQAYLP